MLHQMNLNPQPFAAIKNGKKDVELRLNDEKRKNIQKGDTIEFTNTVTGEKLMCAVIDKKVFADFNRLYEAYDPLRIGYSEGEDVHPDDMLEYYSKEKTVKYGAVAIEIVPFNKLTPALLVDAGICPTCFDKVNDSCLYGDKTDVMLYENDNIECFFVKRPRATGHIAISSKEHYKDMLSIPDSLCAEVFTFAKGVMNIIKDVYGCESVYLCTMCDGPMNHFHIQLIPRYANEKRGSGNFVKPRDEYINDSIKTQELRKKIKMI